MASKRGMTDGAATSIGSNRVYQFCVGSENAIVVIGGKEQLFYGAHWKITCALHVGRIV